MKKKKKKKPAGKVTVPCRFLRDALRDDESVVQVRADTLVPHIWADRFQEALEHERDGVIPYLQSVLAAIGTRATS